MKTTARVAVLAVTALVLSASLVSAADAAATAPSSTHPPKNLKQVGDHWTPWDPPQPAEGSYLIQRGDTFWDLSGKWLGDPYLWPQVWDQNRYVLDSHWIYPGDPLTVPAKPNVVPPEGPPPSTEAAPSTAPETTETAETAPAPPAPAPAPSVTPALIQIADEHDLYCSGWVAQNRDASLLVVAGAEHEKTSQSDDDLIYLPQGRNQGVQAGNEYVVVREDHDVVHPATQERIGTFVQRMGRVRVLCAQEDTAIAVVVDTCESVDVGDELLPWKDLASPMMSQLPTVDQCTDPSGLAQGFVVDGGADELVSTGAGNVVATDLGEDAGARPGTILTLYKDNGDLPRIVLGQAVVLEVDGPTSMAKIIQSHREVRRGDRAEIFRQ